MGGVREGEREEGEGNGPSPEDFDCSIEALGDADDAGGASCLLGVMRQEGFHASPRAYRSVIYACARVGLLSEAMALAKEMQSSSSDTAEAARRQRLGPSPSVGVGENPSGLPRETAAQEAADVGEGTAAIVDRTAALGVPAGSAGDAVGLARSRPTEAEGVVSGDTDDGAEFDLAVVYNCIVCNFARAATQAGDDGDGYNRICEHRTNRDPAQARRRRGVVAEELEEERGGDSDDLVALLAGVAERAEGSLTDEAANGGVEVIAIEGVSSVPPRVSAAAAPTEAGKEGPA